MKRLLSFTLAIILMLTMSGAAFADLTIKPVDDPWNNPENLVADGNIYYASSESGYIVIWATPACNIKDGYLLLDNKTPVLIDNQVKYMDAVPWGSTSITVTDMETGESSEFRGWVLMTDLCYADGTPAYEIPIDVPVHPIIPEETPIPTETPDEPEAPEETETPAETTVPQRPAEAITVSNTYNNAIVYTCVAIAAAALALVVVVLIKHKALNKKGE